METVCVGQRETVFYVCVCVCVCVRERVCVFVSKCVCACVLKVRAGVAPAHLLENILRGFSAW